MEKRLRVYQPNEVLDFGKYKGHIISEVYQFVPSYIDWCLANLDFFIISIENLKKLPKPTPMKLNRFKNGNLDIWISNVAPSKNYIHEAHDYLSLGKIIPEQIYEFTKETMKKYEEKKQILKEQQDVDNDSEDYLKPQSYNDWLRSEFGDDASTAYWNLD